VTHNHVGSVETLLDSLRGELGPRDELIVVDNASRDGTAGAVRQLAPEAIVLEQAENLGFPAGANRGAAQASGDLLVLLNPDLRVLPSFGEAIRRPLREGDWGAWMGLVTLPDGHANTTGGVSHFTGVSWAGQVGAPVAGLARREVAWVSGACLAIPLATWRELGGMPAEFFLYCEDVDLSFRLRLRGMHLGIEPGARVEHDYEFHKGPRKWRLLERNRWAVVLRTYPPALLMLVLPALIAGELAIAVVALSGGWLREKLLSWVDVVRALPRLLRERREIQRGRCVSADEFAAWLVSELDSPYLDAVARSRLVNAALRAYWRVVRAVLASAARTDSTTSST
jgi:N-acetylglucosaminyl-diphospho-decaprenol L-rhamnosyltransferase